MNPSRRSFMKKSTVAAASTMLAGLEKIAAGIPAPNLAGKNSAKIPLKILATNWGFSGTYDEFAAKAKAAGYDGLEIWMPTKPDELAALLKAVEKHGLEIGFLFGGWSANFAEHKFSLESAVNLAAAQKPLYINTHVGRDYFSLEQNLQLCEFGLSVAAKTGVPVFCETHRGRCAFSANSTRVLMDKLPGLRLTADLSHWCCVHESLLEGYEETLEMALQRTDHIHARIGHSEGPQVNDPRAPEWEFAVKKHFEWWDKIVENRLTAGAKYLTFLTEFGPPHYLPALPYTLQPVANQWDINVYMMKILRERYGK